MKFFKATAMALVAGAGLALVASQAVAQDSSSTATTSINGNTEDFSIGAGFSDTQLDFTHTEGSAIAAAVATPIFTASFGASAAGGSTTGPETENFDPGSIFNPASYGPILSGGGSTTDNGETDTLALNHIALWIHASASDTQGSATTSNTTSTGNSVAGLFVFNQTLAVPTQGSLRDDTPGAPVVLVSTGDFNATTGAVSLNQVAGVGNQQGNNLSVVLEAAGGSNSVNVEGNQTLADAGTIDNGYTNGFESASIQVNAFQNITGAVSLNQAAGVANQQVNNLTVGH